MVSPNDGVCHFPVASSFRVLLSSNRRPEVVEAPHENDVVCLAFPVTDIVLPLLSEALYLVLDVQGELIESFRNLHGQPIELLLEVQSCA